MKYKIILRVIVSLVLLSLPLLSLFTQSATYQDIITTSISNAISGQNIFFVEPLTYNPYLTAQNYYVINQYGYYVYSYLFSSTPPLITFYEPSATNDTFYVIYGNSISPQYSTTNVFSNLFNFYLLNTSVFNVTGAQTDSGLLIFRNDSHLYFQPSVTRYQPGSVLFLYNFLSPGVAVTAPLSYSGAPLTGGYVFFKLFQTQQTASFNASLLEISSTNFVLTNYINSPTLCVDGEKVSINGQPPLTLNAQVNEIVIGQSSTQVGSTTFPLAPYIYSQETFATNFTAVFNSLQYYTQNFYVGNAQLIYTSSTIIGNEEVAYVNGHLVNVTTAPTSLSSVSQPSTYIVENGSKTLSFVGIPRGSTVQVTYANGTQDTFTADGKQVNSVGPTALTNLVIPVGPGITVLSIYLPTAQYKYQALVGFTDFVHDFVVNITNNYAYLYVNNTKLTNLGNAAFPLNVVIGTVSTSNGYDIIGFIENQLGNATYFILPSPVAINNVVPYIQYSTSNNNIPLILSEIGVTLANGLFYQLNGQLKTSISEPILTNSIVESVTTQPGLTISVNNGHVSVNTNSSATGNLIISGASGYQLQIIYQNVQQTLTVSSNYYTVSLPSDVPVLVAVDPTTRTITINGNGVQTSVSYVNTRFSVNKTATVPLPATNISALKLQLPNISLSNTISTFVYYAYASFAIYMLNRNYQITGLMWYGMMIWSMIGIFIAILFAMPELILGAIFGFVLSYLMKYVNK